MTEEKDLRDLVGEDVDPEELMRLQRVHEQLIAAGPPPELSPVLQTAPMVGGREAPRRGRFSFLPRTRLGTAFALVAGVVGLAFGAGYLTGHRGFDAVRTIEMRGTAEAPSASASVAIGSPDKAGNVPMRVRVRGLPELPARGHYKLYLTRRKRPVVTCGTFKVEKGSTTTVRISIPYTLKENRYDGWVVTREQARSSGPGPVVLTTFGGPRF